MDRRVAQRAVVGIGRELISASGVFRAVVGTVSVVLIVWALGWSLWFLAVILLGYIAYALVLRAIHLEHELHDLRTSTPTDAERRRLVRDGLSSFADELQRLMQRARTAFDAGGESWTAFQADAEDALKRASTFVDNHLGAPELAEFGRTVPLYGINSRDPDAPYSMAVEILSVRKHQLERFIDKIPSPV